MEKKFIEEGKRTSMNDMKLEALESIGFTWAKRKGEASWMHKYHELEAFLRKHGHCNVATKYAPNPALGRWVSTQRSEYKKFQKSRRSGGGGNKSKHMTQTKIDMLNGLGFKWEMLPNRSSGSSSNGSNSGED